MAGHIEVAIAGGAESMTMVPMTGYKFSPNPYFAQDLPHYYTNMGLTAENVAVRYEISREDQDEFALRVNQRASAAVDSGLFDPSWRLWMSRSSNYADEAPYRETFRRGSR